MSALAEARQTRNLSADELRSMIGGLREEEYVLIDVRQPEEYQAAHIPGAILIPLMDVESRLDEIAKDKHKIFYCRSGNRSGRAAEYVVESHGLTSVFNLTGGMIGWNGDVLPDFPNVKAFESAGTLQERMRVAMDLEKGAERFYQALAEHLGGSPLAETVRRLASAEVGHARSVYNAIGAMAGAQLDPFDEMYAKLAGDLLESGEPLADVLARARDLPDGAQEDLLELALQMEHKAYNLYRNIARDTESPEARKALLGLAEQEKGHVRVLLHALGDLAQATS